LPWLAAQPEGTAQRPAYLPFGALGTPRRLGQRNDPSRKVPLLGLRERLAAPVIRKLSGLIWMHVIHLPRSRARQRLAHRIALGGWLLIGPPGAGGHLLAPDTATLEKRC
jgi:hypothetical protein